MYFDNVNDGEARLGSTIITYKGKALYVTGIDRSLKIHGHLILHEEEVVVDQRDPEVSLVCPPVGYINLGHGAVYFMRQPVRRWKQGLDARALVSPYNDMRERGRLSNELLARCIEGDYPSFEKAIETERVVNPFKPAESSSIAFCREFSVGKEEEGLILNYKGREVGVVEGGRPILKTNYHWLAEALEAAL